MGRHGRAPRGSAGRWPGVREGCRRFGNVGGWPTRSPPRSSRARSTSCCTWCPRTRSTSSTSPCCPSSTASCSVLIRAARPDRLQPALRVPARGGHPDRAEVPEAAARAASRSRTTRTWSAGRSATSSWPACSSAGPTPPPPTSSWPWPSRRRARCPARSASTTTSWSTPRTCWPGITPEDLAQAYLRGSAERPVPRVDLSHVTVDTVSVSEAVSELHRRARVRAGHLVPGRWSRAAAPASRSSCASWPCSSCARWAG